MAELLVALLALLFIAALLALGRLMAMDRKLQAMWTRLHGLEREVTELKTPSAPGAGGQTEPQPATVPRAPIATPTAEKEIRPAAGDAAVAGAPVPPPLPPPLPPFRSAPAARGSWEEFMGAKLFAWLGGLAAFLGAAFFLKYSFEHAWISPALRATIAYAFAFGLVIAGLAMPRERYAVTGQTLIATGIVCLLAVTSACHAVYQFAAFGVGLTFFLLLLTTVWAFVLAVQRNARVIAVLGLLAGFLIPTLLRDDAAGAYELFGYVVLLDVGLIALALRRNWPFLVPLAAFGTVARELIWTAQSLAGSNFASVIAIHVIIDGVFIAACLVGARGERHSSAVLPSTAVIVALFSFVPLIQGTTLPIPPAVGLLFACALVVSTLVLVVGWVHAGAGIRPSPRVDFTWASLFALAGVAAVEYAWSGRGLADVQPERALAWYAAVDLIFAAHPFIFWRRYAGRTGPWATAALSGVVQYLLVYHLVRTSWPELPPGIVPAAMAVVPLGSFWAISRDARSTEPARLNQLAWFGGAGLLFVTLIIPVQLEREWRTVGWALEGAALLWLHRRLPHDGLKGTAVALLVAAFARLALNPAVLSYHPRASIVILNWYFYTYGIVTCALVYAGVAARQRNLRLGRTRLGPLFNSLAALVAFVLLNLEIADYFTPPRKPVLMLEFTGNFGRDMTYTVAWALFALGLLLIGIWKAARGARYASLGLLAIAMLKLFMHDLAQLGALYRVGALFGVAIIASIASWSYQRFRPGSNADHPAP